VEYAFEFGAVAFDGFQRVLGEPADAADAFSSYVQCAATHGFVVGLQELPARFLGYPGAVGLLVIVPLFQSAALFVAVFGAFGAAKIIRVEEVFVAGV